MVDLLKQKKSDEEILQSQKTDKIGKADCTDELLSELLRFAKEKAEDDEPDEELEGAVPADEPGKVYGNKDKEQKYPFPALWADHVVIRESQTSNATGKPEDEVEIPSSVQLKPFAPSLFKVHVKQGMFKGKTVKILHEPK